MVTSRSAGWPGTQVWYQPGGVEGPNVVTSEADLQPLLSTTFAAAYGGCELVIDGQYSGGEIQLTQQLELFSTFDVRFTNVRSVDLAMGAFTSVFFQPKEKITCDLQCTFTRSNTAAVYLAQVDPGDPSLQMKFKNIIWDPAAASATGVQGMLRIGNGLTRAWFEDCALNPDLTAAGRVSDRLLAVATPPPDSLEINWFGPNAGRIQGSSSTPLIIASSASGFSTVFKYGTFGGSLIDLSSLSAWAATTPTVVSRQP